MLGYLTSNPDVLFLVQSALVMPAHFVTAVASTYLLHVRKRASFIVVYTMAVILSFLVGRHVGPMLNYVIGVSLPVIAQLAFSRGNLLRRVFIIIVIQLAIMLAEVPPTVYWLSVTDIAPSEPQAIALLGDYLVLARLIHIATLVLLYLGIGIAERKITQNRTDEGLLLFAGFLFLQYVMVALGIRSIEDTLLFSHAAAIGMTVIVIVCLAADALCFYRLDHFNKTMRIRWRADMLQEELEDYLARYEGVERVISSMAQVRHDLRNQANVILFLLERNDATEAREHLLELAQRVMDEEPAAHRIDPPQACGEAVHATASPGSAGILPGSAGVSEGVGGGSVEGRSRSGASCARLRAADTGIEQAGGWLMRNRLLLLLPASQALTSLFLFAYALAFRLPMWFYAIAGIATLLCLVADALLLRAVKTSDMRKQVEIRAQQLESQAFVQRRYYERLVSEFEEVSAVRRGIVDALNEMGVLLERGEVDRVMGTLRDSSWIPVPSQERFCANRVVNALVAMKKHACDQEGISFTHELDVPDSLPIPDVDLCSLFSNMIDNGIGGCLRAPTANREISLSAKASHGVLLVDMVNSCPYEHDDGAGHVRVRSAHADEGCEAGRAIDEAEIPAGSSADANACDSGAVFAGSFVEASTEAPADDALVEGGVKKAWAVPEYLVVDEEAFATAIEADDSLVGEHGWGLRILQDMADRHKGSFSAGFEGEGLFRTSIMLTLSGWEAE